MPLRIATRLLTTYSDGFRLGRRTFRVRIGRGRGFGLGVEWRRGPWRDDPWVHSSIVVTVGWWAASMEHSGTYIKGVEPEDDEED